MRLTCAQRLIPPFANSALALRSQGDWMTRGLSISAAAPKILRAEKIGLHHMEVSAFWAAASYSLCLAPSEHISDLFASSKPDTEIGKEGTSAARNRGHASFEFLETTSYPCTSSIDRLRRRILHVYPWIR